MDDALDTAQLDASMAPKVFRPGEFVIIRMEMTAADDIAIRNRTAKMRGQGKAAELILSLGDAQLAAMQRMIVGWNIQTRAIDPHGNIKAIPLPFSAENVSRLRKPVWDYVYRKINEFNPDMEEDEQAGFLPSVIDASEDGSETERVFRLK